MTTWLELPAARRSSSERLAARLLGRTLLWRKASIEATRQPVLDVLVIGTGQAGFVPGHALQQTDRRFRRSIAMLAPARAGANAGPPETLFTVRAHSAQPEIPVSGDQDRYPTNDEITDYLEAYAARPVLPIALATQTPVGDLRYARFRDGADSASK